MPDSSIIEEKEPTVVDMGQLKFAEPDLTVIVGSDGTAFRYHSIILANYSVYIDTLLASTMKESSSKTIHFPEIESQNWLDIIAFVTDPLKARQMSVAQAMRFSPLYDKYDFPKGMRLCSDVLERRVEKLFGVSTAIEIFVLADQLNMKILYSDCVAFFQKFLGEYERAIQMSTTQLTTLAPLVAKDESLLELAFADKDQVTTTLWPRYFLSQTFLREMRRLYERLGVDEISMHKFKCICKSLSALKI